MAGVAVIILIAVVLLLAVMRLDRGRSIVDEWASENGFTLVECTRRSVFRGPFWLTTSKSQLVYEITVRDQEGRLRHGYLRVGGRITGLLSDRVEVRWND